MSKQKKHSHRKDQHHPHGDGGGGVKKKLIHHDWRFWTAIVLMGLAIVAYVVSFDESFRPGVGEQPEVPAAAD